MRAVVRDIACAGRGDEFDIILTGDWHWGSAQCCKDGLRRLFKSIADNPRARWVGMGDYLDLILRRDKRYDPAALDRETWDKCGRQIGEYQDTSRRELRQLLRPIMDKCLGLLVGNHEDVALRKDEVAAISGLVEDYRDWAKETSRPINDYAEELGYNAVVVLRFVRTCESRKIRQNVTMFLTHGSGGAASVGGRVNKLAAILAWMPQADVIAGGHFHDHIVRKVAALRLTTGSHPRVIQSEKIILLVPSLAVTYPRDGDSYASKRLYPPSVLGPQPIHIKPFHSTHVDGRDLDCARLSIDTAIELGGES